ncbi:MAG: hypothetical protein L0I76_10925 [Pseudonocardia sp.]|nr:hypothetical protein [Pseudonocardia sp.]
MGIRNPALARASVTRPGKAVFGSLAGVFIVGALVGLAVGFFIGRAVGRKTPDNAGT